MKPIFCVIFLYIFSVNLLWGFWYMIIQCFLTIFSLWFQNAATKTFCVLHNIFYLFVLGVLVFAPRVESYILAHSIKQGSKNVCSAFHGVAGTRQREMDIRETYGPFILKRREICSSRNKRSQFLSSLHNRNFKNK